MHIPPKILRSRQAASARRVRGAVVVKQLCVGVGVLRAGPDDVPVIKVGRVVNPLVGGVVGHGVTLAGALWSCSHERGIASICDENVRNPVRLDSRTTTEGRCRE